MENNLKNAQGESENASGEIEKACGKSVGSKDEQQVSGGYEAEIIDIFDESMNFLFTAPRERAHAEGLWHKSFHCWIVRKLENGRFNLVVQKRAAGKRYFPCLFDITAAGHYLAGEDMYDGLRELEEELSVKAEPEMLHLLGTMKDVHRDAKHINKEFCRVFVLRFDRPINEYTVQKSEVAGLAELDLEDAAALAKMQKKTVNASYFDAESGVVSKIDISMDDFVHVENDNYDVVFAKLNELAKSGVL